MMAVVLAEYDNQVREIAVSKDFVSSVQRLFTIPQNAKVRVQIYKSRWERFIDMSSVDELHDGDTVRISTSRSDPDVEGHNIARANTVIAFETEEESPVFHRGRRVVQETQYVASEHEGQDWDVALGEAAGPAAITPPNVMQTEEVVRPVGGTLTSPATTNETTSSSILADTEVTSKDRTDSVADTSASSEARTNSGTDTAAASKDQRSSVASSPSCSGSGTYDVFLNPDGSTVYDHRALPISLQEKFNDPNYQPTDNDRLAIIDALHSFYTAKSQYPHKDKGYDRMLSIVFSRYPQLHGKDVVEAMRSFRTQPRNKFKRTRKRHPAKDVNAAEREGIPPLSPISGLSAVT